MGRWKFGHLNTQSDAGESYKKQEVGSEHHCTVYFKFWDFRRETFPNLTSRMRLEEYNGATVAVQLA